MNLGELIKSKRWKVFMGYVYGWGAAIVMIGALFKLEHLKYSGVLLAVGLITEAFIFSKEVRKDLRWDNNQAQYIDWKVFEN